MLGNKKIYTYMYIDKIDIDIDFRWSFKPKKL